MPGALIRCDEKDLHSQDDDGWSRMKKMTREERRTALYLSPYVISRFITNRLKRGNICISRLEMELILPQLVRFSFC